MSKLQRIVDGQTLLFTTLPRIFQSLTVDLPSGSIRLSNGEHAYWRLNRNLADLKKSNVTLRECAARLAQAYKAMTESESFMNHYGLVRPPEISNESNMTKLFVGLLQMNGNRIEQSSVYYGGNKPVVDTITIPLGHQVQFNATRGMVRPPPGSGLKGRLWMSSEDAAIDVNHFSFNIYSPVVNLAERLHQDRLSKEITNKLRQTLPGQVNNPVVEFDEGQFDQFVGNGLKALVEKTAHPSNGQGKKKSVLVEAPVKAESKVGRGLTERIEYNPEFQGKSKAPGGGIIGNSLKTVIGDSSLGREFSEGSVQVPARGMTTACIRIDDPAFVPADPARIQIIAEFLSENEMNAGAAPKPVEEYLATNDPADTNEGSWAWVNGPAGELFRLVQVGGQWVSWDEYSARFLSGECFVDIPASWEPAIPTQSLDVDGDVSAAEMAAQVAEAITDAKGVLPEDELHLKSADGMLFPEFQVKYHPANYAENAYADVIGVDGATFRVVNIGGEWLTPALILIDIDKLSIDHDTQLVIHKVRSEVGNGTITKSVVVPIVLSPTQKAHVRGAFMHDGVGEVWFYDIILSASTAIVLQWDMIEGEPRVDVQGQLIVADKDEGAGDHSFALPA